MAVKSKHIVFVTGAFVSNICWDEWRVYFERKGYSTIAPPWPFKTGEVSAQRARHPNNADLGLLTLQEVIDSYIAIIKKLPEKPIVIGHSLGGMITQVINDRGLAAAAVAIHSIPTLGVFPYEFSFLKSGWKAFGLFTSLKKTYMMSFKDFQYAFVNGMPLAEQRKAYDSFAVPESKTAARGGLTAAAKVDYNKPHAPLLFTAGSTDHITPAHLNRRNFKRYKRNGSIIEYKEYPGKNHFVLGLPTWKEDADDIYDWLQKLD